MTETTAEHPTRTVTVPDADGRRRTVVFSVKDGRFAADFPFGERSPEGFTTDLAEVAHEIPDGERVLEEVKAVLAVVGTDVRSGMPLKLESNLAYHLSHSWGTDAWRLLRGAVHGDEISKSVGRTVDFRGDGGTVVELAALAVARDGLVAMAEKAEATPLGRIRKSARQRWGERVAVLRPILNDVQIRSLDVERDAGRLVAAAKSVGVPRTADDVPTAQGRTALGRRTRGRIAASEAGRLVGLASATLAERAENALRALGGPDVLHPALPPADRDPRTYEGFVATEGIVIGHDRVASERVPDGRGGTFERTSCRIVLSRADREGEVGFDFAGPYETASAIPVGDVMESLQHVLEAPERYADADEMFDEQVGTGTSEDFRRTHDAYVACTEVRDDFHRVFGDDVARRLMTEVGDEPPFPDGDYGTTPAPHAPTP